MFKQMGRGLVGLLAVSAMALSLNACTTMPTLKGYNHTSIPNVPYVNLDVHKQEHQMTTTDRACVFNGGDMITDTGTRYKNSGRFMHRLFLTTMQQYNLEGAVDLSSVQAENVPAVNLQDVARQNYCNLIVITRPIYWMDSQISPGNVALNVDMYDTSSVTLLNSVTLNARSKYIRDMFLDNSPLKPVIETYVDSIYR